MEKNFKFEMRDWTKGDLVKISTSDPFGAQLESYGVVAATFLNKKQTTIFPAISVYNMRTGIVEDHYVYDLELISESGA